MRSFPVALASPSSSSILALARIPGWYSDLLSASSLNDIVCSTSSSNLKQPTSTIGETVGAQIAPPALAASSPSLAPPSAAPAEDSPAVVAFGEWQDEFLGAYLKSSEALGGVVAGQVRPSLLGQPSQPLDACTC